jgi:hypothetical protein
MLCLLTFDQAKSQPAASKLCPTGLAIGARSKTALDTLKKLGNSLKSGKYCDAYAQLGNDMNRMFALDQMKPADRTVLADAALAAKEVEKTERFAIYVSGEFRLNLVNMGTHWHVQVW